MAVFVGVRAVNLAQLGVALPAAWQGATAPALFAAVLGAYVIQSLVLGAAVLRHGVYRDTAWGWSDVGFAAAVLAVQPLFTAPEDLVGTWTAWGFACTQSTAVGAAVVFRRRRETAVAIAVLAGTYLAATLPAAHDRGTVAGNAMAYVGFAVLARLLVGYLRRLAADAQNAREEAVRVSRTHVHDQIGVLRLLSARDLDPELARMLRSQAAAMANRGRRFLEEDPLIAPPAPRGGKSTSASPRRGPVALTAVVVAAVGDFADLPLEVGLDLAEGAFLPAPAARAVEQAVATVLANVRMHADAGTVVVHADADPGGGAWEITVADDGRGFDLATTPLGFGLGTQAGEALHRHGVTADVRSIPGEGTTVTLRGPMEDTP